MTWRRRRRSHPNEIWGLQLEIEMQAAGAFWAVDDLAAEAPQPQRLAAGPWPGAPHCWALLPPAQSPSGCLEVALHLWRHAPKVLARQKCFCRQQTVPCDFRR